MNCQKRLYGYGIHCIYPHFPFFLHIHLYNLWRKNIKSYYTLGGENIQLENAELLGSYSYYQASTMQKGITITKPYKLVICMVASQNPHDGADTYSSISVNSSSKVISKRGINNGGKNQGASYAIIINPNIGDTITAYGFATMGACFIGIN